MRPNLETAKPTSSTILGRALEIKGGKVTPEGAPIHPRAGHPRGRQEAAAQAPGETTKGADHRRGRDELESYVQADQILSILRAQAILALKKAGQEP